MECGIIKLVFPLSFSLLLLRFLWLLFCFFASSDILKLLMSLFPPFLSSFAWRLSFAQLAQRYNSIWSFSWDDIIIDTIEKMSEDDNLWNFSASNFSFPTQKNGRDWWTERIDVKGNDFGSMVIPFSISIINVPLFTNLWTFQFHLMVNKRRSSEEGTEQKEVIKVHCCGDLLKHQRIWPLFWDAWKQQLSSQTKVFEALKKKELLRNLQLHNFPFSSFV